MQLGAFANLRQCAELSSRISRTRLAPVGVEPKVRQVNGLFRVFVGPYPTRDDAKRMADRLRDALGVAVDDRACIDDCRVIRVAVAALTRIARTRSL